ncbi:MAG: right-handed parallel beta-helix repeat-containing protein, partial [Candidatus Thorarchaeota archaeon]
MNLRKNKSVFNSLFYFLILLILFINYSNVETNVNLKVEFEKTLTRQSWNLGDYSILIDDSDPDHNWSKTSLENDWCSGEGTKENPYKIEDIRLETAYPNKSLIIRNSSVYFNIQNCTLYDCNSGIEFYNVSNGSIFNNSFINMDSTSIYLMKCVNINISENHLINVCLMGVAAVKSYNINIIDNVIDTFCGMNYGIYHYDVN